MFRLKVPRIFWESLIPRFRWMTIDISNYLFELLRIHFSNCFQRLIFTKGLTRKNLRIRKIFFLVTLKSFSFKNEKWLERFLINFSFSTIIGIPVSLRNYQIATNLFFLFFLEFFWWKIRSTFAEKLPRSSREVLICLLTVHRWRKISWNKVDHDPFIFSAWTISTKCHLNSFYLPLSCSIYVAVYFKCLSHERGDQRLSIFRLVESRDKKKQGPRTNGSWTLEMDFQCSWNTSPFHVSMIT